MKKSHLLLVGLVALAAIGFTAYQFNGSDGSSAQHGAGLSAIVYKTPTCGCCSVYSQYLKSEGVATETKDLNDLTAIKDQHGVPRKLASCHTSVFGEYVVEGHIPLEVVDKLLTEKPDIKGIALPGMPSGSPGMPGPKVGEWTIYALHHDGTTSEYMKY